MSLFESQHPKICYFLTGTIHECNNNGWVAENWEVGDDTENWETGMILNRKQHT